MYKALTVAALVSHTTNAILIERVDSSKVITVRMQDAIPREEVVDKITIASGQIEEKLRTSSES